MENPPRYHVLDDLNFPCRPRHLSEMHIVTNKYIYRNETNQCPSHPPQDPIAPVQTPWPENSHRTNAPGNSLIISGWRNAAHGVPHRSFC